MGDGWSCQHHDQGEESENGERDQVGDQADTVPEPLVRLTGGGWLGHNVAQIVWCFGHDPPQIIPTAAPIRANLMFTGIPLQAGPDHLVHRRDQMIHHAPE